QRTRPLPGLTAAAPHRPVLPRLRRAAQRARRRARRPPDRPAGQRARRPRLRRLRRAVDRLGGPRRPREAVADRPRAGAPVVARGVAAGLHGCPEPAVRWLAASLIDRWMSS